jgi:hypothetical protein
LARKSPKTHIENDPAQNPELVPKASQKWNHCRCLCLVKTSAKKIRKGQENHALAWFLPWRGDIFIKRADLRKLQKTIPTTP